MKKSFLFKRGKYYHYQYLDENNHKRRISTKCRKKNEALEFVSNFKKSLEKSPNNNFIYLADMIKMYENYLKPNYSRSYLAAISIHLRRFHEFTGDTALKSLRTHIIEDFLTEIAKESKIKAKKYLITINTFFNKAVSWEYITTNPAHKIRLPKSPAKAPLFISETELTEILNKEENIDLREIYYTLFHTGMRLGELINLTWNQILLNEKVIKISNTDDFTTKGKTERNIPINEKLFNILYERYPKVIEINRLNYIFTMNGRKYNGDYISKSFKKVIRSMSNINQDIHLHSLRHSFASNLVQKGISLFHVKELLGHQSISTTQIYSHLTLESLRNAVRVLE